MKEDREWLNKEHFKITNIIVLLKYTIKTIKFIKKCKAHQTNTNQEIDSDQRNKKLILKHRNMRVKCHLNGGHYHLNQ